MDGAMNVPLNPVLPSLPEPIWHSSARPMWLDMMAGVAT